MQKEISCVIECRSVRHDEKAIRSVIFNRYDHIPSHVGKCTTPANLPGDMTKSHRTSPPDIDTRKPTGDSQIRTSKDRQVSPLSSHGPDEIQLQSPAPIL